MILVIDNYDSFTYNLVQYLAALGPEIRVFRNDRISTDGIESEQPDGIVISPGPCTPREAGVSIDTVRCFSGRIPILGVCLGHQSVGEAFGAVVSNAGRIMHGKVSATTLGDSPLYRGIKSPAPTGRYHSLAVMRDTLPPELVEDATSDDGEIMGMHHSEHPTFGVQFHPESILTPCGKRLLRNFLKLTEGS